MTDHSENKENQQRRLTTGLFVLGAASSSVLEFLGILVLEKEATAWSPVLAFLGLLAAGTVLNEALALGRGYRIARRRCEEGDSFLLPGRDTALKASEEKLHLLRRLRIASEVYAALVLLLALAGSFYLGGLPAVEPVVLLWLPFAFFAGTAAARLPLSVRSRLPAEHSSLPAEDFPMLWSLCRRAAEAVGCREELSLSIHGGTNIFVAGRDGECQIHLGIDALLILTEGELYECLLRALAPSADKRSRREERYASWLGNGRMAHPFAGISRPVFRFLDAEYEFQYQLFQLAAGFCEWDTAVKAVLPLSDQKNAASSLLRLRYYELWCWESDNDDFSRRSCYAELLRYLLETQPEDFRRALTHRRAFWDGLIEKEILSEDWPDKPLREKIRSFGVEKAELLPYEISPSYRSELLRAGEFVDGDEDRQRYEQEQLSAQKVLDEWEAAGRPLRPESFGEVITALRTVGRIRDAFTFCDLAIDELPYTASIAYPSYVNGCKLLHSWNEKGLAYVYRAMEGNDNYIELGLQTIAEFCRFSGNREALREYEDRAPGFQKQNELERSELATLRATDELRGEELPPELKADLLRAILSIEKNEIERIFLVRKTISPTRFTSVMVIQFVPEVSPDRTQKIMEKIFNLLDDSTTWQFSLFRYDRVVGVPLEKIEGSMFYEREQGGSGSETDTSRST